MAKTLIRDYVFTPGGVGSGTISFPGRYTLDKILLITNVTDNVIIYNFADTTFAGTTATFSAGVDSTYWPTVDTFHDGFTTITLQANTATMSAGDALQIYVDNETEGYGTTIRPWQFGTDAIERMRVSQPQSLIDADFEYGLQPTKWAGYGTVKGYPSAYDIPGIDLAISDITTDYTTTSSTNSMITVTFDSDHNMSAGQVVNMSGLSSGVAGFSRADGNFIIDSAPTSTTVQFFARGIVGTADGNSLYTEESLARRGGLYANASIPVSSATSNGADPSVITLNFSQPHGLIPGTNIHTAVGSGTNADLASGPFFIKSVPTSTSLTYTARGGAIVGSPASVTLYALSNATILHRPADGGVILSTKTPTYAATVVRQTKRHFRYQSGKGFLWSSGTLFAPVYDTQSIVADGTAASSTITVKTDDIDHGLQPGASVFLRGVITSGYEGTYTVQTIVDDYTFTVTAQTTLGDTTAVLEKSSKIEVRAWIGAAVRAGLFDDQNGVFFEFDGNQMFAVQRRSTQNISGTINVTQNSATVTGSNTRFTEQVRAGEKIIIRGMTHFVTSVPNNTTMYITPDYRGITAQGVRAQQITEKRVPQSKWNMDKADGTGPSGFNWNFNKMQMIGMEYSWYGAGFIHFMVRGSDGRWLYVHRMKNNNINDEAYMRAGNLPVRYSIENDTPITYLTSAIDSLDSNIPGANLQEFTNAGTLMIDNEIITYTGRSVTDGPGNFTGCTRSATLTQYQQGSTNNLTAGPATTHNTNVGIIEISNTCSPTLTHWGSALIMDGGFDFDRGYLFNYKGASTTFTTTPKTIFLIRLAPSVSNSSVGRLGAKELLNRSQMLLEEVTASLGRGSNTSGEVTITGIINPRNFSTATWKSLNGVTEGGQPSFAQVSDLADISWTSGTYAEPGESIFSFVCNASRTDSLTTSLNLEKLKEMSGAPLGGDFQFPDGPDILAINVQTQAGEVTGSVQLRWTEAQA